MKPIIKRLRPGAELRTARDFYREVNEAHDARRVARWPLSRWVELQCAVMSASFNEACVAFMLLADGSLDTTRNHPPAGFPETLEFERSLRDPALQAKYLSEARTFELQYHMRRVFRQSSEAESRTMRDRYYGRAA